MPTTTYFKTHTRGMFVAKHNVPTHNKMDGGMLYVEDMDGFHAIYARAVVMGEDLYMVCKKSMPVFRMFFDVDAHLAEEPVDPSAWYTSVCKFICSTLLELFSDSLAGAPLLLIASVADCKPTRKANQDCFKYGMHINVPDLHVTTAMALRIRRAVVQKMQNNFAKSGPTSWNDDIDEVVYGPNGLRMIFSKKCRRCKCTLKDRASCEVCKGVGKIDEGRAYVPVFTMTTDFVVQRYADATQWANESAVLDIVKQTCIRSTRTTPSMEFNRASPNWFEDTDGLFSSTDGLLASTTGSAQSGLVSATGNNKRRHSSKGVEDRATRLREGIDAVEGTLEGKEPLGDGDIQLIQDWIEDCVKRRTMPREYKTARVTAAFSFKCNSIRSHAICRLDSQFCMNIGREHATNTVYLELHLLLKRAYLKCYCRCDTIEGRRAQNNRAPVRCRDYRSSCIPMDTLHLSIRTMDEVASTRPRILAFM